MSPELWDDDGPATLVPNRLLALLVEADHCPHVPDYVCGACTSVARDALLSLLEGPHWSAPGVGADGAVCAHPYCLSNPYAGDNASHDLLTEHADRHDPPDEQEQRAEVERLRAQVAAVERLASLPLLQLSSLSIRNALATPPEVTP